MSINPGAYTRNPLHVEAVRVTEENLADVAEWCGGSINTVHKFIKPKMNRPTSVRHTKASVGDWVVKMGGSFRVYSDKAFTKTFHQSVAVFQPSAPLPTKKLEVFNALVQAAENRKKQRELDGALADALLSEGLNKAESSAAMEEDSILYATPLKDLVQTPDLVDMPDDEFFNEINMLD